MSTDRLAKYVSAAVAAAIGDVRAAAKGERNATLNRAAFSIGQLAQWTRREDVEADLMAAAAAAGLPRAEAAATVRHGLTAGARQPRELPPELAAAARGWRAPASTSRRPAAPAKRPAAGDLLASLAPPEPLRPVLVELWNAIREPVPGATWSSWATSRGLDVDVVREAGVRTFNPCWSAVRAVLEGAGEDTLRALGLLRVNEDGETVPAWELFKGEAARLWVPVWSAAWRGAPVAYRWRSTDPHAKAKTIGPPVEGAPWRDWPLGVTWPDGGRRLVSVLGARRPLVVVEGEPDWLTVAGALEPEAHVIGLPGSRWADHWWPLLADCTALVVATHDDGAGDKVTPKIGAALAVARPDKASRPTRARIRPPVGGDWNDAGAAGLAVLVEWVNEARSRAGGA